jgi:hypothetical protein
MTGDKGSGILDLYRRTTKEVKSKDTCYLDQDYIVLEKNRCHRTMDITTTMGNTSSRSCGSHRDSH